jgi:hypothetical protein
MYFSACICTVHEKTPDREGKASDQKKLSNPKGKNLNQENVTPIPEGPQLAFD